jgi:hypothetical protein
MSSVRRGPSELGNAEYCFGSTPVSHRTNSDVSEVRIPDFPGADGNGYVDANYRHLGAEPGGVILRGGAEQAKKATAGKLAI